MITLRRLAPFLRPYWRAIAVSTGAMVLVVAAELQIPRQIQHVIDDGIALGDAGVVAASSALMVGLALASMALFFVNIVLTTRVSEAVAADIRAAGFHSTQGFSFANLDRLQTGDLLVRLTSDVNVIKFAIVLALRMIVRAPLMLVGSLVMLVLTSPRLALLLGVLLPLTAGMIWAFGKRSEPLFAGLQARLDRVNTIFQENIAGVRVVKAFVRAEHESARFGTANEAYLARGVEVNQLLALLMPTMLLMLNVGVTAIIWFGGLLVLDGQLTTGAIVAFTNYLLTAMFPIILLGMVLPQMFAAGTSFRRILEINDAAPRVVDRPDAARLDPGAVVGRVAFEGVSLHYEVGDGVHEPVLRDIDLVAEPGQTVAVLGATGSGKTSLVMLVPRLYDVTAGRVTIDGVDVRDVAQASLRAVVAVVLQEAVLFSGTVRDNIRFGRPDATDAEVEAAARAAEAHDFIMARPEGYDAVVGQRGANFSGGQRQRLAIARALCVRPRVLILDDSTSAVDVDTEARIQRALAEVAADATTFVVAQRISTVLYADLIVVLDQGRVVARGDHRTLLATSPIYREIYASQLGAVDAEALLPAAPRV